jgi:eukaryotic translation initiation factor 2C
VTYEDGHPVEGKGVGRKVIDRVETYDSELSGKDFAYDGEKSLFTVGSLSRNKLDFTIVLEDVQSNGYTIRVCDSFILGILYYCQFISNF